MKLLLSVVLIAVAVSVNAQKNLVYSDYVYESGVKTIQLYPDNGNAQDNLAPAVTVQGQTNLVVEFDDMATRRANFYAKLIHCNYDWTKSNLMDLDFLNEYNEFPLNDYTTSGNTFQPYVHYKFQIPPPKITGNYLLIVYRDDQSHLSFSKRFMVYNPIVTVLQDKQNNGTSALSFSRQPLNFTIDYGRIDIMNPLENLHVVIRQNQRWDNVNSDLKPTFLRDADSQAEFRYPDSDKAFLGGNEFRFVDFRSLNSPGQNTGSLDKSAKPFKLKVAIDLPRIGQSYSQYNDYDGNYLIDNQDYGDGKTDANYLPVTFFLKTPAISDAVYVVGAFNNYVRTPENKMSYNALTEMYEATLLLKQGYYNYQFVVDSKTLPVNYFEGDHFETENFYEVLVYSHTFQPNADQLIGYSIINVNARQ